MRRKIQIPALLRILVQADSNRWEWITTSQFADQEIVLLKEDGYYVPVKF